MSVFLTISGIVRKILGCATHILVTLEVGGDVHDPELALAGGHFIGSLKVIPNSQNYSTRVDHVRRTAGVGAGFQE